MSLLRTFFLPLILSLALVPAARAGDEKAGEKKSEETKTIRGVISDVTIVGEADVDLTTRKAVTAEMTYITVIGHAKHGEGRQLDKALASAVKEKNEGAKPASNEEKDAEKSKSKSEKMSQHQMNIYVLAISPDSKCCLMSESRMDGKETSASAAKEEVCPFENLEVGDRVEITFEPKAMAKTASATEDTAKTGMKHGRHRVFLGAAQNIKIMPERSEWEHGEAKK